MSLRTEYLILLDTPGRLPLWNMAVLEDNGILVASCLILLKSLVVKMHLSFSTTLLTVCNKMFDGSWIMTQYLIVYSSVLYPFEILFTIFDFSDSVTSLFWLFTPDEKNLPNNYAHLDIG